MIDFESNMKLVYYVYNLKFKKFNWLKDDLIQVGNIGLLNACKTFNEDTGNKFSTYAIVCITNEMRMLLKKENKKNKHEVNFEHSEFINFCEREESDNTELIDLFIDIEHCSSDSEMFKLWAKGYNQIEIAKILGRSQSRVCRKLKKIKKEIMEVIK